MMSATILYIEDNAHNMQLIRRILNHQGYTCIEATTGEQGYAMAQTEKPDLILMDINLPDIDGLQVTSKIKTHPDLQSIPIIALTAYDDYGDEDRALTAGCDHFIAKPVSRVKLIKTIQQYLNIDD